MTQLSMQKPVVEARPRPTIYTVLLIVAIVALIVAIVMVLRTLMGDPGSAGGGYGLSFGDMFGPVTQPTAPK